MAGQDKPAKEPADCQVEATLWKVTITDELKLHRKHILLLFKSISLIHAQIQESFFRLISITFPSSDLSPPRDAVGDRFQHTLNVLTAMTYG